MGDNNDIYITQDERDPDRLEGILRHSSRRQEATLPVMLVQLQNTTQQPLNSEQSESRPSQRRATVVNTAGTPQLTVEDKIDPFEWYFRKDNPDLRKSLVQEGTVDELNSRRKSRIGGDQMEQMVLMLSNQNLNKFPLSLNVQEDENENRNMKADKTRLKSETDENTTEQENFDRRTTENCDGESKTGGGYNEGFNGDENFAGLDVESLHGFEINGGQSMPCIDAIINSFDYGKEMTVMLAESSLNDRKSPFKDNVKNASASFNEETYRTVMPAEPSFTDQKSPQKEKDTVKNAFVSFHQETETIVMPAQYSFTDQKSPFKKNVDEIKPRPSSRVRVLIMLDEWDDDDDDGLEDDSRRKRHAKGDGKRGRDQDPSRREPISDKDKRKDKSGKGIRSDENDDIDRYRGGEAPQRGRKRDSKDGDLADRDKENQGRRQGARDSDKTKYGDGTRSGEGPDKGIYDADQSKRGIPPGDRDYNKNKYGDGTKSEGPDGGFDDDRRGNKNKYGDGTRSEGTDGGFDDGRTGKKGRGGDDKRGKGRPGTDTDGTKYRLVTMPKAATTLTTRRRYHLQVTDHEMKEPWFNSCFNISKENNVDFNYEGPVKITPYYIGDKFS